MIRFIRNYFKMKSQEIQLKLTFYGYLNTLIASQNDILVLIVRLYNRLKDLPIEELDPYVLKEEIIAKMVEIVHEYRNDEKTGE